ncbi:MAG: GIY-YIG nuclease family protein [Patescibacteria group bacterium]
MPAWFLYIVRCKNGSLYTGITTDVAARVLVHNAGKGAKYTRAFGPVVLAYSKKMKSATAARVREAEVKRLTKKEKEKMCGRV